MKSFLVEMKPKDKSEDTRSHKISSQDQQTAELWGQKCLLAQRRDPSAYRIIATEIIETPVVKPVEKPKEEVKEKLKARPKVKKNTLKTAVDQAVKNQQA